MTSKWVVQMRNAGLWPIMLVCGMLLVPSFAEAVTYYTATSGGSDGNSCATAQTHTTGKATIAGGLSCLSAGDTLEVKAGTYDEALTAGFAPDGISDGAHTIIKNYSTDTVLLLPTTCGGVGDAVWFYGDRWITWDGIDVQAPNCVNQGFRIDNDSNHIVIQNSEISNAVNSNCIGMGGVPAPTFISILNNVVHECGKNNEPFGHNIYTKGFDHIIDGNTIYNSAGDGGSGIQAYEPNGTGNDRTRISNNIVYLNVRNGIYIGQGDDMLVYNNIIYSNNQGAVGAWGISISTGAVDALVFHNTIYNHVGTAGINIASGATRAIVRNNILYSNGNGDLVVDLGANSTIRDNTKVNPTFASGTPTAALDFVLISPSAAIGENFSAANVGTSSGSFADLTASIPGVATDYFGDTRDSPFDAGAIGFDLDGPPVSDGTLVLATNTISWTYASEAGFTHYRIYLDCTGVTSTSPYMALPTTDALIKKDGTGTYNDLTNKYVVPKASGVDCPTLHVRIRPISSGTEGDFSTEAVWTVP